MTNIATSFTTRRQWYFPKRPVLPQKYYYPPRLDEDLEKGFDEFIKFDEIDEHLDSLLASLQDYEETSGKDVDVDIITWRGMMTKIMTVTPLTESSDSRRPFLEEMGGV